MSNTICLKPIMDLTPLRFHVPSYQRGYRWDEKQIIDLLEDVYDFAMMDDKSGKFYCLQPIVVKKNNDCYEVIDGQQRLTTIKIIQKYLGKKTFEISYVRKGSKEFLDSIADEDRDASAEKNIDFFFMEKAFEVIRKWFNHHENELNETFITDDFNSTLLRYCQIIWYEVDDGADVESIFTRLNIGKIPLTNAELIKALLLKTSNFEEDTFKKQLEIALEWDTIENSLQDDRVWYFINPQYSKQPPTRIEYLFDSISNKNPRDDEYFTFRYFSKLIEEGKSINEIWQLVKKRYQIIMEWYGDQVWFHLIGFLTSSKSEITIKELINAYYSRNYRKHEFEDYLKEMIKARFKGINLEELDYEQDKASLRDILLLFNVITVMNKSSAYSRFPFDSYNKNVWSLEHIHAQNASELKQSKEVWASWIKQHLDSFKKFENENEKYKEVVKKLEAVDIDNLTRDAFIKLFDEIVDFIKDDYGIDLHGVDNLALLNVGNNSSLSNNFFDVKRELIIEMDRNGEFIPVCTRNVFLKYYSKDPSQIHYWGEEDRKDYLQAIKNTLNEYLEG